MTRTQELLTIVATDLERGASPLNEAFLRENAVTYDECLHLSDVMAMLLRGYAVAPLDLAAAMMLASTAKDRDEATYIYATLQGAQARKKIIEQLDALNSKAPQEENNPPVRREACGPGEGSETAPPQI